MKALGEHYDAALFDLDGVIYLGPYAIDGVPDALAELRSRGVHLGYVTNNAARTPATVAEHLVELGIDAAEAMRRVSTEVVFTTHTPVPAGHDRFPADLIEEHLGPLRHVPQPVATLAAT